MDTFKSTFAGFYYKNTLLQLASSLSDLNNQRAALIFQQSKRRIATIWLEDLQSSAPRLMEELLRQPGHTRELFVRAAREYCQNNSVELEFCTRQIQASIKIGDLQAQNLNKLISVQGLLIGSSRTRPKPQKVVLICRACGHRLEMEQQFG